MKKYKLSGLFIKISNLFIVLLLFIVLAQLYKNSVVDFFEQEFLLAFGIVGLLVLFFRYIVFVYKLKIDCDQISKRNLIGLNQKIYLNQITKLDYIKNSKYLLYYERGVFTIYQVYLKSDEIKDVIEKSTNLKFNLIEQK